MMNEKSDTYKVYKSVSAQTLITILTAIIEVVAFSLMSRLLTIQDFGYYAAVTAVSSLFAAFSDAGIGSAIVQRKTIDQKYIDNAFTLCLLFGLFSSSLLLVCSGPVAHYIADETMQVPLMLVSITLLTGTLSSISFSIMQKKLQFFRMGIIRISALIFTTIVSIFLAIMGFGYYAIIAKVILYSIITLFVSYIAAHTRYYLSFDLKVYKEIFGFGGWLMASAFFRKIAEQIDRLMISSLFSVTILGMYSRPKEFINTMTGKLCDIFDSSLFPIFSSFQDRNEKLRNSYQSALYYLNIVGLMITLTFIFNSELIIRIFLGTEWMSVNTLFIVLAVSGVLMINGSLGDIYLRSLALTKQQFFLRILQSVASVILILVAVHWGVLAIAFAYLSAYGFVVLFKMGYISNKINFGLRNSIILIVKSYQITLVYMPIYLLCRYLLPNTVENNIIKLCIFFLLTIGVFIFFPRIVGTKYKKEMHYIVVELLRKRTIRNKQNV